MCLYNIIKVSYYNINTFLQFLYLIIIYKNCLYIYYYYIIYNIDTIDTIDIIEHKYNIIKYKNVINY